MSINSCIKHLVAVLGFIFAANVATAYEKVPLYPTLPTWTLKWTDDKNSKGTIATDADHGGWEIYVMRTSAGSDVYALCVYPGSSQARAVVKGSGFLDLRGAITGPDHKNVGSTASYRIVAILQDSFRGNDGAGNESNAYGMTGFYSPGTLSNVSPSDGLKAIFHNDGNPRTLVQDVYFVEPNLTTFPSMICNGCTSFKYVYFDCPALTTLNGPTCTCGGPKSDANFFDDWNFPALTTVTPSTGCFNGWSMVQGTLHLPSAQRLNDGDASFAGTGLGAVLLGTRGGLEYVGNNAFSQCQSLTNVVLGAAPVGMSLTLGGNAFGSANLKRVWFNGDEPPALAPSTVFGTGATAEGQITFYVRDTPGWAEILAEADASANRLVDAKWFGTAQKQRVERFGGFAFCPGSEIAPIFDVRFADKFNEKVTVEAAEGFPYVDKGCVGLPVRLTASCSSAADEKGRKAHFHRWDGVPVDLERQASIVISDFKADMNIRAIFAHDWIYDKTTGTMENGIWKVRVKFRKEGELALGTGAQPTDTFTGTGNGILDFNGDIVDGDGVKWAIVSTTKYCMTKTRDWDNSKDSLETMAVDHPSVIVFPETIVSLAGNELNFNQSRNWPLQEVIFIAPNCESKPKFHINGPMLLDRMTIRAPAVTDFGECFVQNATLADTDVSTWDLSGVRTISALGFVCSTDMKGTLSLPSLVSVADGNFKDHSKLEGVVLAANLTLTALGANAFAGCSALKDVVIGNSKKQALTVGADAFSGTTRPEKITFLGPYNQAAADQILSGTEASDTVKTAILYASSNFGWSQGVAALTDAEREVAPDEAVGVYREGSRKAWMVYKDSPFDPKGLIIVVE